MKIILVLSNLIFDILDFLHDGRHGGWSRCYTSCYAANDENNSLLRELQECWCDPAMAMAEVASQGFVECSSPNRQPLLWVSLDGAPSSRPKNEHFRSSTSSGLRPLESVFTGLVRNHPFWTDLVYVATSFVGRPRSVTIFIDVRRNHPLWTDLVHLGPLFTHETAGPWPLHSKHSH